MKFFSNSFSQTIALKEDHWRFRHRTSELTDSLLRPPFTVPGKPRKSNGSHGHRSLPMKYDHWLVVFSHPSEKWWSSSIGMIIETQYFWENIKCSKPPTRTMYSWFTPWLFHSLAIKHGHLFIVYLAMKNDEKFAEELPSCLPTRYDLWDPPSRSPVFPRPVSVSS